jgi:hypothetical protein
VADDAAAVGLWQSLAAVLRSKLAALGVLYGALTSAPAARACKADLQEHIEGATGLRCQHRTVCSDKHLVEERRQRWVILFDNAAA